MRAGGNIMKPSARDVSALILRIALGIIFIPHGFAKVFGAAGPAAFAADMPQYGIPAWLGYIAAYAEIFGAALLIPGLLTRLNAFLLACIMVVAMVVIHGPEVMMAEGEGLARVMTRVKVIEFPLALFAIAVSLVLLGAGRISLDHVFRIEDRVVRAVNRDGA